jgi:nucleoside-triphosphatase
MGAAILLTGSPGCGKTTLIRRVVSRLRGEVGGFYTQEIREGGVRQGFQIITFDGQEGILAHKSIDSPRRIGKYGVALETLEAVGVAGVQRAILGQALVVIDEIGPMEMLSDAFCRAVLDALNGDVVVFGSVVKRSTPFSDRIKARPDVTVLDVHPGNRDTLLDDVLDLLRATGRCDTV